MENIEIPAQNWDQGRDGGRMQRAPALSTEALVGIAFLDIADYTFLSKFLSPAENQALLNGIFTAFNIVLQARGAYLNKIQGDSIMFHFGGPIDPSVAGLGPEAQAGKIAKNIFYTCVELQRVCLLFNEANEGFLKVSRDAESAEAMRRGFEIIRALRTNAIIAQSINAFYQIRIRIGASIGEVSIGLFGPRNAKNWDVIGVPVIQAKRMETSAPVGGLRITKELYAILERHGVVNSYTEMFRREAASGRGKYRDIGMEELFKAATIRLKEKSNVELDSYSVQVDPLLPERVSAQTRLLLDRGEEGMEKIVFFLQYYRGNAHVLNAIEALFSSKGIRVDKAGLLKILDGRLYRSIVVEEGGDAAKAAARIQRDFAFRTLFARMGDIQDAVKDDPRILSKAVPFTDQESYLAQVLGKARKAFAFRTGYIKRRSWFHSFLYPATFTYFRAAMFEYQGKAQDVED
jgi:adenylate cyclase